MNGLNYAISQPLEAIAKFKREQPRSRRVDREQDWGKT